MAKRGRKPKNIDKNYFSEIQEQAVLDYLNTTDEVKRNKIYVEKLHYPFEKMIESIIRRYHLYVPDEEYEDTFYDTLSFLLTKVDKFKMDGKTKAYSYYGTICKNYLIGKGLDCSKRAQRNPSYDLIEDEFTNNINYVDIIDRNEVIASETIDKLIEKISLMIESPSDYGLKENELKLGIALKKLLEDWDYVISTDCSSKLNKNAILLFLRDETGLDTKGIRDNMKKYKKEFLLVKNDIIS